jgi:hypothetical protein
LALCKTVHVFFVVFAISLVFGTFKANLLLKTLVGLNLLARAEGSMGARVIRGGGGVPGMILQGVRCRRGL